MNAIFARERFDFCNFPRQKRSLPVQSLCSVFPYDTIVMFLGGALVMGWYRGIPLWGGVLLVVILEGAMAAMLYAMWLEKRRDTKNLNRSLQKFQGE